MELLRISGWLRNLLVRNFVVFAHYLSIFLLAGFAFVLMEDPRDAEDAVRALDGGRICGRRVKV